MSPERCQSLKYWTPADIWAIGLVLYEMLSGGRYAFDYHNQIELISNVIDCKLKPLPDYVDKRIATFVWKLLHKNPDHRPTIDQILKFKKIKDDLHDLITVSFTV